MLASQDFASGSTVGLTSFRYPIQFFCKTTPVIVLDAQGKQIYTMTKPYEVWGRDYNTSATFVVPTDQVWEFFYVMRTPDIPIICSPVEVGRLANGQCPANATDTGEKCYYQSVFDANNGSCVVKPGIVHLCTDGIFDERTLSCAVYPDAHIVCPSGSTYVIPPNFNVTYYKLVAGEYEIDPTVTTPYCKYIPPKQASCPYENSTYDSVLDKCVYTPGRQAICPGGSIYDASQDVCRYYPRVHYICPKYADANGDEKQTSYNGVADFWVNGTGSAERIQCSYTCPKASDLFIQPLLDILQGCATYSSQQYCNPSHTFCTTCGGQLCSSSNSDCYNLRVNGCWLMEDHSVNCSSQSGGSSSGGGSETCYKDAQVAYEPCIVGYTASTPGVCVQNPTYTDEVVCPSGWTKMNKNTCVAPPSGKITCDSGWVPDPLTNLCIKTVPSEYWCTQAGGIYSNGNCYKQALSSQCPAGFNWDAVREGCIMYRPLNETYICLRGTYNPLTNKCLVPGTAEVLDPIKGSPYCDKGTFDQTTQKCIIESTVKITTLGELADSQQAWYALVAAAVMFTVASAVIGITIAKRIR